MNCDFNRVDSTEVGSRADIRLCCGFIDGYLAPQLDKETVSNKNGTGNQGVPTARRGSPRLDLQGPPAFTSEPVAWPLLSSTNSPLWSTT
jgi:hypothetical protein